MSQDDIALAERLLIIGICAFFSLVLLSGVLESCHPHPTRAEAIMEAL